MTFLGVFNGISFVYLGLIPYLFQLLWLERSVD